MEISKEKQKFIREHLNDRPRTKYARLCGVDMSTYYRYVRKFGGELKHELSMPNEYYKETTRKYWATMSASEIRDAYGVPKSKAIYWAQRLGLKHTPETEQRLKDKMVKSSVGARNEESHKKASITWKKNRRLDELRVMSGLPRETKFHLKRYPQKTRLAIWHLERRYNYFRDEEVGGLYTLFYDEETKRTPREQYYIDKYHLKFEQA